MKIEFTEQCVKNGKRWTTITLNQHEAYALLTRLLYVFSPSFTRDKAVEGVVTLSYQTVESSDQLTINYQPD